MKILLDECVTKHLKPSVEHHEVVTVVEMGWSGIKNGKLMAMCVENGFDTLLTIDKKFTIPAKPRKIFPDNCHPKQQFQ